MHTSPDCDISVPCHGLIETDRNKAIAQTAARNAATSTAIRPRWTTTPHGMKYERKEQPMTDKDPKDMTASELLRQSDSNPCSMCHLVLAGDESCATTGCAEWAYRLADKIDAELAEARKDAIRESKKPMWWFRNAIKCGYDWPEPTRPY